MTEWCEIHSRVMRSDPDPQRTALVCSRRASSLRGSGRDCRHIGWPWLLALFMWGATVSWVSMMKETAKPPDFVLFQGAIACCRWRIAACLAGGSGCPAHSTGSRQPSKAWQKSAPVHAAMLQSRAWLRKVWFLIFLSYGKMARSSLH